MMQHTPHPQPRLQPHPTTAITTFLLTQEHGSHCDIQLCVLPIIAERSPVRTRKHGPLVSRHDVSHVVAILGILRGLHLLRLRQDDDILSNPPSVEPSHTTSSLAGKASESP